MSARPLNELAARDVVRGIKQGTFSAEAVTRACLDRIAERELALKAWAFIDPQLTHRGSNGLPIGIQLVARHYEDEALLVAAQAVFERLGAKA